MERLAQTSATVIGSQKELVNFYFYFLLSSQTVKSRKVTIFRAIHYGLSLQSANLLHGFLRSVQGDTVFWEHSIEKKKESLRRNQVL